MSYSGSEYTKAKYPLLKYEGKSAFNKLNCCSLEFGFSCMSSYLDLTTLYKLSWEVGASKIQTLICDDCATFYFPEGAQTRSEFRKKISGLKGYQSGTLKYDVYISESSQNRVTRRATKQIGVEKVRNIITKADFEFFFPEIVKQSHPSVPCKDYDDDPYPPVPCEDYDDDCYPPVPCNGDDYSQDTLYSVSPAASRYIPFVPPTALASVRQTPPLVMPNASKSIGCFILDVDGCTHDESLEWKNYYTHNKLNSDDKWTKNFHKAFYKHYNFFKDGKVDDGYRANIISKLIELIQSKNYGTVVVMSGSSRQSCENEQVNASHGFVSAFTFPKFVEELSKEVKRYSPNVKVVYYPGLTSDYYNALPIGTTVDTIKKDFFWADPNRYVAFDTPQKLRLQTLDDMYKTTLLFLQMTMFAKVLKQGNIFYDKLDYYFLDDRDDILTSVKNCFTSNKNLLPSNINLLLYKCELTIYPNGEKTKIFNNFNSEINFSGKEPLPRNPVELILRYTAFMMNKPYVIKNFTNILYAWCTRITLPENFYIEAYRNKIIQEQELNMQFLCGSINIHHFFQEITGSHSRDSSPVQHRLINSSSPLVRGHELIQRHPAVSTPAYRPISPIFKEMKVGVFSLDFDGCLYRHTSGLNPYYYADKGFEFFKKNDTMDQNQTKLFIEWISQIAIKNHYTHVIIISGSNRQSTYIENVNVTQGVSALVFPLFTENLQKRLSNISVTYCPLRLADAYNYKMIGDSANEASEKDSFESEKEKLETLNDEKKGSLLFVQMTLMHHILNHLRVNCNSLDFHFVDDKEAILFAVYSSFTDYPEKFPMQGSKLYLYYKSIAYAEEVNDPPELYDGANKKYPIVFPNKACVKDPMVQIAKFVCKGLPVINSCEDIIKIINSIGTFSKKRIVYLDSDDWKCFEVDETLPSFLDIEAFCRNFKLELPLLSRVSSPLPLSQSVASRGFQPIQANISAPQTFKILFEKVIDILDIKNGGEFKSVKSKCSIQFQFNNISQKYTIGSGAIYNDPATRSGNMCLIDSLLQLVDFKGDRKKECLRIKTALFNDKKVSNLVDFINSEDANTILNIHDSKFKYYTVLVHAVYFDEMNPRPYYRVVSTSNLYENMSSDLVEDDSKKIIHIYFNGSDHFEPILPNQAFHSHKAAPMTTCEEFSF